MAAGRELRDLRAEHALAGAEEGRGGGQAGGAEDEVIFDAAPHDEADAGVYYILVSIVVDVGTRENKREVGGKNIHRMSNVLFASLIRMLQYNLTMANAKDLYHLLVMCLDCLETNRSRG